MAAKIMKFDIKLKYFFLTMFFFYPKSFVLCHKIVLPLEYMVLAEINIIITGYYRIYGSKFPFSLKIII